MGCVPRRYRAAWVVEGQHGNPLVLSHQADLLTTSSHLPRNVSCSTMGGGRGWGAPGRNSLEDGPERDEDGERRDGVGGHGRRATEADGRSARTARGDARTREAGDHGRQETGGGGELPLAGSGGAAVTLPDDLDLSRKPAWKRTYLAYLAHRGKVWRRARGLCAHCGVPCTRLSGDTQGTIDHVVPRSRGGSHELANLQLLCRDCNRRKGAGPDRPWRTS